MNKKHLDRVAVYYHSVLHSEVNYQPNPNWDEQTLTLLELLESNITPGSTLTDIGSGAGKWLCLLSQHCSKLVGIEPNDYLRNTSIKLINTLHLNNIEVTDDYMPRCIDSIKSNTVILMESIYLHDWRQVYDRLLDNNVIQTIIVFDGPDTENTQFDSNWTTPFNGSRRPLQSGDEHIMTQMAQERAWNTTLVDVTEKETHNTEWMLIAKRK